MYSFLYMFFYLVFVRVFRGEIVIVLNAFLYEEVEIWRGEAVCLV